MEELEVMTKDEFYVWKQPNKYERIVKADHMIELLRAVRDEMWKHQGNTRDYVCHAYFFVKHDGYIYSTYDPEVFAKTGLDTERYVLVRCTMQHEGMLRSMHCWPLCSINPIIDKNWKKDIAEIRDNHELGLMGRHYMDDSYEQSKVSKQESVIARLRGVLEGFVDAGRAMKYLDEYILCIGVGFQYDGTMLYEDGTVYWHASNTKDDKFNATNTTKRFTINRCETSDIQRFIEVKIGKEIRSTGLFD